MSCPPLCGYTEHYSLDATEEEEGMTRLGWARRSDERCESDRDTGNRWGGDQVMTNGRSTEQALCDTQQSGALST